MEWLPWVVLAATNTVYGLTLRTLVRLYREATDLLQRLLADSERRGEASRLLAERYQDRYTDFAAGSGRHRGPGGGHSDAT